MPKVSFTENDEIAVVSESGETSRKKSEFIENYKAAAEQLQHDNAWKYNGVGAKFTQTERTEIPPEKYVSSVNGVCLTDSGKLYYSATVENSSGIMSFYVGDEKSQEGHVLHYSGVEYGDIDVDPSGQNLVTSVKTDPFTRNLAVVSLTDGDYTMLTGGDSKDEHPSYSNSRRGEILYSTAGIGRDMNGDFVRYGNSSIAAFDTVNRSIRDVCSDDKHSLIQPKDDKAGNIYFIERPPKEKLKKPNIFLEILLIPFRLIYAIYKFLEAFTRIFTGKGFTTKTEGDNPGKNKSERDIIIDGYKIQAKKNLNACEKRKEKYPGYAPNNWVLKKLTPSGEVSEITKGVISYSLTDNGEIVYTNGKSVILIDTDGKKQKLADATLALRICAEKHTEPEPEQSNPFDL